MTRKTLHLSAFLLKMRCAFLTKKIKFFNTILTQLSLTIQVTVHSILDPTRNA